MRIKLTPCPPFSECLSPGVSPDTYTARLTVKPAVIMGVSREAEK